VRQLDAALESARSAEAAEEGVSLNRLANAELNR